MKARFIIMSFAVAGMLSGCAKEQVFEPTKDDSSLIPLNIDGSIEQVRTKATASGFVDKDALGLYAVNYSSGNSVPGTLQNEGNQADNVKYVFDGTNYKWDPVKAVYYKDIDTNVDLYLYYPYQASIGDVTASNFEVMKDQSALASSASLSGYEASDLLWGKASGIAPTESKIAVSLSHKMSTVKVMLVEKDGFMEGEFALAEKKIILTNTTRKATVNYATGEVTPLGDPQLDGIVMCPQEDETFRAIVVPQTIDAGSQMLSITINGVAYSFKNSTASTEYLPGRQLNVTVNVSKKTPSGEYELSLGGMQISDWVEDRITHGGEARQYYVVNVPEPGQLGRAIKSAKKNPDKIKNLKVVGTVNDNDFYFMRDSMAILEAINMKESVLKCMNPTLQPIYKTSNTSWPQYSISDWEKIVLPKEISEKGSNYIVIGNMYIWFESGVDPYNASIPEGAFRDKSSLLFFEFPESVDHIGKYAFSRSHISGSMIIPDGVTTIGDGAFSYCTMVTSLHFGGNVEVIGSYCFMACSSLSGSLYLPASLRSIGEYAFQGCRFEGNLHLPDNLESMGNLCFYDAGFSGSLIIPDRIHSIPDACFAGCGFNGFLDLNNVTEFGSGAFARCHFKGNLVVPEGVVEIVRTTFESCHFSSLTLPSTLRIIDNYAFSKCQNLTGDIVFPEGLTYIADEAFSQDNGITGLKLPSTLLSIGKAAFWGCTGISSMSCTALQVPSVLSDAFYGVPKDNFTLGVPENMVARYQASTGWSEFRRIAGHYDFSISRNLMRGLNASISNTYTLRVPSGFDWHVDSKPDWVTVTPDHGTGRTEVTVTFAEMPRTDSPMYSLDNVFERIGTGRNGEIVFIMDEKDYRSVMGVEQYDSPYHDGQSVPVMTASQGKGIDIVYMGEGYDAKDIASGKFLTDVEQGNAAFFGVEPYATYKDYFNVNAVVSLSKDSGIGTVSTVVENKFGTYITQSRLKLPDASECFAWADKAKPGIEFSQSLVIMLLNTSMYEGVTMMYGDGSAISFCPISQEGYPYDFRGIIQHEAGGHGFGKLGDEYIYHLEFIQNCGCGCCDHPKSDDDLYSTYGQYKSRGWFRNLSLENDVKAVPWSHLIYDNRYSDYVDIYEGAYMHSRGMYRSEAISCMNNNIPYFSAISRQAIVERIMDYAGKTFNFEDFVAKDSRAFGVATKGAVDLTVPTGLVPDWREHTQPVYMGEKPQFNR